MFAWLKNLVMRVAAPSGPKHLHARYDAAQTTDENRNHWANADSASASASNNPSVRRTLRNRSRYEYDNNGYCRGLIQTIANDRIGTGPRLQLSLPVGSIQAPGYGGEPALRVDLDEVAGVLEILFADWMRRTEFADKLRVMDEAQLRDGECFAQLITNSRLDSFTPQVDVSLLETDRIDTPGLDPFDPLVIDGIRFDNAGNPVAYSILRYHPGDIRHQSQYGAYEWHPATHILHWFRPARPGQVRGVPEVTAALPLYALLRRYTLAVTKAAEFAASIAGVMKSTGPVPGDVDEVPEAGDRIPLEHGSLLTLPAGWDASGFNGTQPTTTYAMFKEEVLNEIGRGVNAPFNVVSGNSSRYNYSSGRLDHLIYHRSIWISRERMRVRVLDPVFRAWLNEAALLPNFLPPGLPPFAQWSWDWNWDAFDSIDPQKDAQADQIRLASGTTTLAQVYAAQGINWREALKQLARERAYAAKLKVDVGSGASSAPAPVTEEQPSAA